jgi:hypothetical protein
MTSTPPVGTARQGRPQQQFAPSARPSRTAASLHGPAAQGERGVRSAARRASPWARLGPPPGAARAALSPRATDLASCTGSPAMTSTACSRRCGRSPPSGRDAQRARPPGLPPITGRTELLERVGRVDAGDHGVPSTSGQSRGPCRRPISSRRASRSCRQAWGRGLLPRPSALWRHKACRCCGGVGAPARGWLPVALAACPSSRSMPA